MNKPALFTARAILRQLKSLGYRVSYFQLPPSLRGTTPARTEMHAVGEDSHQHIAGIEGHGEEQDYRVACVLAQSVDIDLEG